MYVFIGYYKSSLTAEYTEDSPPGDDFMSQLCQDWEAAARLPDSVPCRSVSVRIGKHDYVDVDHAYIKIAAHFILVMQKCN